MSARYGFKFKGSTLSRDITIVLALKTALLLILWLAFFSDAQAPGSNDVAAVVLTSGKAEP